ncbi:MAG: anhydro-N-acetylmuramic acid kinase, partial [Gammaproteobacteria bacterium]|nr:anhydro-N-acetylmuramic acid kinase [Gammaproteobacteria bacterium]
DRDGRFAASGTPVPELLAALLAEPYLQLEPPKSTGRDTFNSDWLARFGPEKHLPEDVQATLAELTVATIAATVTASGLHAPQILICGGGASNAYLLSRLAAALPRSVVSSTAQYGLAPERIEACAFAWLAHNRLKNLSFPHGITGAGRPLILGAIYTPA